MKINKQELHSIFEGIINNEESKFKELYEKYYFLVEAIAFSILKNRETSEDISQEVFTKIFELPKEQLPTKNEASWIYTVTKNEAIVYLRKQKNALNIEDVYNIEKEDEYLNDVIAKDTYNSIIKVLDSKEQEILSLKVMGDLSFREIGNLLDIPTGTVQWKYYKAIHLLRTIFSNLIVFIITIGLYINNKFNKNRNKVYENIKDDKEIKEQENVIENEEEYRKEEQITQDSQSSLGNEAHKTDAIIPSNEQSTTIANTIQNNESNLEQFPKYNYEVINMILIGIAGISLILNIILLIIFSKHQQKRNKKTSK